MTSPLRIGVLGAARITPMALLRPAKRVPEAAITAVAARDPARARTFAAKHGIPRVHDSYAALASADPVEVAFFDGLIALRGENDPEAARAAFDRFLELAPDDPRAAMIRGLRDEADASAP